MPTNKRGTVGEIMTFFVAFIIIIPLLVLLLFVSSAIAGKKNLPVIGEGGNEINFEESFYSGQLSDILESQVEVDGKFVSVEELILLWNSDKDKYKDILKSEVKNVLTSFEFEYTDSNTENLRRRGFALKIYGKDELVSDEIKSDIFRTKDNPCIISEDKTGCRYLVKSVIPVSPLEKINIALLGSEGAVKK